MLSGGGLADVIRKKEEVLDATYLLSRTSIGWERELEPPTPRSTI
jgi:hypothetical protein